MGEGDTTTNLDGEALRLFRAVLGKVDFSPEDLLNYAYGVFHSPGYRNRYADFLKVDFPRLPLPASEQSFLAIGALGDELVSLHLMESPSLDQATTYIGPPKPEVGRVGWCDDTVWLDAPAGKKGGAVRPGDDGVQWCARGTLDVQRRGLSGLRQVAKRPEGPEDSPKMMLLAIRRSSRRSRRLSG